MHVPAGAVPKDGPSAGVTMTTALASLLSGRPVRADVAMTGEVSLTGRVLPIGGVKQKLLAAHRAGITTVLIPQRNEPDLDDVPAEVLEKLDVHTVGDVREVLRAGPRARRVAVRRVRVCRVEAGRGGRRRLSLLRRDVGGRQIPAGAGIGGLGVPWGIRSRSRGWCGVVGRDRSRPKPRLRPGSGGRVADGAGPGPCSRSGSGAGPHGGAAAPSGLAGLPPVR